MKIGIYDQYLDTLGGGEKYMFDAASYLTQKHSVSFFWLQKDEEMIKHAAIERFGVNIDAVSFVPDVFHNGTPAEKLYVTRQYDLIIYLSDGSFPFLFAKKNVLMFQHPVDWVKINLLTELKLKNISLIICNSLFTQSHIAKIFPQTKSTVVYPCVTSMKQEHIKKEKIIISVGRFTKSMNAKKQDVLIDAFKLLYKNNKDWKMILAGGLLDCDRKFLEELQKKAKGYPIEFQTNISHDRLRLFYNKSSIYWHATGYGEDLTLHPERTEHFGISTVEAMTADCVPIVFNAGGAKEIIDHEKYGLLWNTTHELITKTEMIIADNKKREEMIANMRNTVGTYSVDAFQEQLQKIVEL